jgi:hypothetical protein
MATNELASEISKTETTSGRYPVNLRFTMPFYPRRLFVTLIMGQEKRSDDRLREERIKNPLNTWGNVVCAFCAGVLISIIMFYVALMFLTADGSTVHFIQG